MNDFVVDFTRAAGMFTLDEDEKQRLLASILQNACYVATFLTDSAESWDDREIDAAFKAARVPSITELARQIAKSRSGSTPQEVEGQAPRNAYAIASTLVISEGPSRLLPLGDRVVVEPILQEEMTASGLELPQMSKDKPERGLVIAAGRGSRDEGGTRVSLDVSVGDVVLFAKYAGTEFKVDSKKLLILKESDLLAIVEGDEGKKKK